MQIREQELFVIGIDPGYGGAICVLSRNTKEIVSLIDMPIHILKKEKNGKTKIEKELDVPTIASYLRKYANQTQYAFLERVHSMPGQGVAGMFNFGKGYGVLQGVLTTLDIRIIYFEPSVWKILMGLSIDKGDSLKLAIKQFPKSADLFKLKKHDGRAEAALMVWFGRDRL